MPEIIFGLPTAIALMYGAAFFYLLGIIATWKSYRAESNEIMGAFMAFLFSMGLALFLMGSAEYLAQPMLGAAGTLAILIGSVIMLRFPLSLARQPLQSFLFYVSMIVAIAFFVVMMATRVGQEYMMPMIMWFMIVVNGIVVSFFVIYAGLKAKERWFKVKAIGGGTGIAACCLASHVAMMIGTPLISAMLQFAAPIIIAVSIQLGKFLQRSSQRPDTNLASAA